MSRHPGFCLLLFLPIVFFVGCSKDSSRGTVKGKVTHKGGPVVGMAIYFEEEAGGGGPSFNLKEDGSFIAANYKGPGLPVGTYKVAITSRMMESADEMPLAGKSPPKKAAPPTSIPEKYLKTSTSGLRIEVKEGENPPFDIDLTK